MALQKNALSLEKHYILASPRKRGGGTADIIFWLAVQYSDSPAFTILKLFRAVTVGIEIDRTSIPLAFRNANIHICLFAFASALSHSLFVGRGACPSRNITAIIENKLIEL